MHLFPYCKWNASTWVISQGDLSPSALVIALGQGGRKQTRLFILSLSKSSKSLNPNVRGKTPVVIFFPIFCPTDLMLRNSGKIFWETQRCVLKVSVCFKVQTFPRLLGLLQTTEAVNYLSIFKYNPWPFSYFINPIFEISDILNIVPYLLHYERTKILYQQ